MQDQPIQEDEILLRRVRRPSASNVTVKKRPDGGDQATSWAMKTKDNELSCSRKKITTPQQLLKSLILQGEDPLDFLVCEFKVSDIKEIGLEIAFTPTHDDPGHCSITGENQSRYPNGNKAKRLARRTRILTEDEIEELS
ncbi:hypothetical protein Mal52_61410 [Symmachiella dynata]|uniref:Uncharacterized protein n=1 Tax=Symmachiella dynata TaxID=2527995 RepID=A0A517ZYR0_9PLAN|nr:hypothetical protein [Symmachiella dynata]QDU47606.1 hypothetical protein Mal52_61410 [Symmachiella dynata]